MYLIKTNVINEWANGFTDPLNINLHYTNKFKDIFNNTKVIIFYNTCNIASGLKVWMTFQELNNIEPKTMTLNFPTTINTHWNPAPS